MAAAIGTVAAAVDLLVELINSAQQISTMVQDAQSKGQSVLSADQWATITGNDDSAEAALTAALKKLKGG